MIAVAILSSMTIPAAHVSEASPPAIVLDTASTGAVAMAEDVKIDDMRHSLAQLRLRTADAETETTLATTKTGPHPQMATTPARGATEIWTEQAHIRRTADTETVHHQMATTRDATPGHTMAADVVTKLPTTTAGDAGTLIRSGDVLLLRDSKVHLLRRDEGLS